MTREVLPGDTLCVRWPAKNHAVASERDRGVFINMPPTATNKDPNQSQLMKMTIAKLPYKNCSFGKEGPEHTPCGGCFKVPEGRTPGTYLIQWRWELNDEEWYTSCWDLKVGAPAPVVAPQPSGTAGPVPTQPTTPKISFLSGSTSIFADLTED